MYFLQVALLSLATITAAEVLPEPAPVPQGANNLKASDVILQARNKLSDVRLLIINTGNAKQFLPLFEEIRVNCTALYQEGITAIKTTPNEGLANSEAFRTNIGILRKTTRATVVRVGKQRDIKGPLSKRTCIDASDVVSSVRFWSREFGNEIKKHASLVDGVLGGYARRETDEMDRDWGGAYEQFILDVCGCDDCD